MKENMILGFHVSLNVIMMCPYSAVKFISHVVGLDQIYSFHPITLHSFPYK